MSELLDQIPSEMSAYLVDAGRLLLAVLCGAAIGLEREINQKGAGLRTHIMIAAGACLFSLVGLEMHERFPNGDPLRLLQGMLLGVGFISGGVIFTNRGLVKGLTTAAGLWVLTGVGMAAGLGYYFVAIFGTVLSLAVIGWMKHAEKLIHRNEEPGSEKEDSADSPGV